MLVRAIRPATAPCGEVLNLDEETDRTTSSDGDEDNEEEDNEDATNSLEAVACKRPPMAPVQDGAKVFACKSNTHSRALAEQIKAVAIAARKPHGHSTVGTPWLYARRLEQLKEANTCFLQWSKEWISEVYGVPSSLLRVPRTEPHIVRYDHRKHKAFKGLPTHQDGSFCTLIMALSSPSEYSGGGTFFPHLDHTVRLAAGEVLLFQGEQGPFSAPHRAQPVSGGTRALYIAFIHLKKPKKVSGKVWRKASIGARAALCLGGGAFIQAARPITALTKTRGRVAPFDPATAAPTFVSEASVVREQSKEARSTNAS